MINIGIEAKSREKIIKILNVLLADEFVLYLKTRNYHWNVKGINFKELHGLFQEQYKQLDDYIDDIAERVRQLGGLSVATLTEYNKLATLKETTTKELEAKIMLKNLLADHESIIRSLRKSVDDITEKLGDAGTADFLTGLMEGHEKKAWMLRASLG
jgi:starvation-inducible DNA-binding protein